MVFGEVGDETTTVQAIVALSPCELTENRRIKCHRQGSHSGLDGFDLAKLVDQSHHCCVTGFSLKDGVSAKMVELVSRPYSKKTT